MSSATGRDTDERRRLEAVIEHLPSGVVLLEPVEGRVVLANAAAERLVGKPLDRTAPIAEHAYVYRIRRRDGSAFEAGTLPSARALAGEVVLAEEVLFDADGHRPRAALLNAAPVRDARGRITGAVVAVQDITQLKELERQREEFISVIAHDLRTPIGVIENYAHVLRHRAEGQASDLAAIDGIAVSARRLATMVADLLDASRLEAHQLRLAREKVDLCRLVCGLVERVTPLLGGHPVRADIPETPAFADADPGRLEQVVTNLVTNAAKFSPAGGMITVTVGVTAGEAIVSVTDEGQGIPQDEQPSIFDRFYRTRSARAGQEGLGLGLYIAHGLVEAHGGRMSVESGPGTGTTMRFALPLAPAAPAAAADDAATWARSGQS